jgi:hypothetical protein
MGVFLVIAFTAKSKILPHGKWAVIARHGQKPHERKFRRPLERPLSIPVRPISRILWR